MTRECWAAFAIGAAEGEPLAVVARYLTGVIG